MKRLAGLAKRVKRRLWPSSDDIKLQKYHEESVKFQRLMAANNEEVYGLMYSNPHLLQHYLVKERLDFYKLVVGKVVNYFPGNIVSASCLDVGCGTGHLLLELRKAGFGGQLVGLDSAITAEACVLGHNARLQFIPGYLSAQNWDSQFDLILCTEVLEHCEYPGDVIQDMLKVIKPKGVIIITVPDGRKDTWEGHIQFWSPESFRLYISQFGMATFDYFADTNFCMIHCA